PSYLASTPPAFLTTLPQRTMSRLTISSMRLAPRSGKSRPIAPQAQVMTLSCALTLQRRRPTFGREKVGRRRRGRPGLRAVLAKQMPGLFLGVAGCPSQSPGNLGSYKHRLWAPRRISMFGPTRARPHQEPIVERLDQVPLLRTQGLPRCPIAGDHDLVTAT